MDYLSALLVDDEPEAPDLFLCHCHKDKRFVHRLAKDLSHLGVSVWLDKWELKPGDSLHECLGDALERSAFVGVMLSPGSVGSTWCRSELDQALTREKRTGKKVVIPLLRRRVQVPPFLEGRVYIDFRRFYFRALTELSGFLHGVDRRGITDALEETTPKNLDDVRMILSAELPTSKKTVLLPEKKYRTIRENLESEGVTIPRNYFNIPSAHRADTGELDYGLIFLDAIMLDKQDLECYQFIRKYQDINYTSINKEPSKEEKGQASKQASSGLDKRHRVEDEPDEDR